MHSVTMVVAIAISRPVAEVITQVAVAIVSAAMTRCALPRAPGAAAAQPTPSSGTAGQANPASNSGRSGHHRHIANAPVANSRPVVPVAIEAASASVRVRV